MLEIAIIRGALGILAALWVVFIILMTFHQVAGRVRIIRWWKSQYSGQLAGVAILGLVESVALLFATTGHTPSLWVFVAIFVSVDIVTARWLWLVWRARRIPPPSDSD